VRFDKRSLRSSERKIRARTNGNRRELRSVELREISVVSAWPAYANTNVEARSRLDAPNNGLCRALAKWRA
jgi:phage head maturation protease